MILNEGLNFYEKEEKVGCIHGYVYPVKGELPKTFFLKDPGCLGWATWKRGWELFEHDGRKLLIELNKRNLTSEFNYNNSYFFTKILKGQIRGKIDSWAIRWYASIFLKDKLVLYPGKSLVFHNGADNTGTNCGFLREFDVEISNQPIFLNKIPIEENTQVFNTYVAYFKSIKPPIFFRFIKKLSRKIYKLWRFGK